MSEVSPFYETLASRERGPIREAAIHFAEEHGDGELFLAVARFAILNYAPSQHAKHALLASLAAHELRDDLGARWRDVLIECAIYAAQSRQPWSEPPILDPPRLEPAQRRDNDDLREAVVEGDRLRAERWLAARLDDPSLAADLFTVASDGFDDLGHKLIVSVAAWKFAGIAGEQGRYATLRTAIWEIASYRAVRYEEQGEALDAAPLFDRLVRAFVGDRGSILSAHALFLLDAAVEAGRITGMPEIERRVRDYLTANAADAVAGDGGVAMTPPGALPVYPLARDCAECLKSFALARRVRSWYPDADALTAAAFYNLQTAPSLEEWSFA